MIVLVDGVYDIYFGDFSFEDDFLYIQSKIIEDVLISTTHMFNHFGHYICCGCIACIQNIHHNIY